ncbi:MAG: 3,4-dihydroxy 2-butanone 4-phosphate synthase / cyclohydrolase, partial [Pseudonocardiales bacterium]|nr:3,4-dihydroxy 2-butanone 4-phosphate synthase / cyclohydrolase [Pseudonocardiales bacterium]
MVSNPGYHSLEERFAGVERAIVDLAAGKAVVVVDDEDRENEGDLVFAAERATPELVSFMVRYTSGYICVALTEDDCDRLDLPPMYHSNGDAFRTAFTVTVDAKEGVSTGISATDRAHTIRLLAGAEAHASDFVRPGHVLPLRAKAGGVLRRPGHTEAAVDLSRLAGLQPAGALCEIVSQKNEGDMARADELRVFAEDHDLALVTIAELIAYRRRFEKQVERVAEARIPTQHGEFLAVGYDSLLDGVESIALVKGDLGSGEDVLVRVHSECLTGDVFGSLRCDCGPQLDAALGAVAAEGRGVVLYVRGHEGRGIGLMHKLQA